MVMVAPEVCPVWKAYNVLESVLSSMNMGCVATKSVFGISNKVTFKPACLATETSCKIDNSPVASLDMILSIK